MLLLVRSKSKQHLVAYLIDKKVFAIAVSTAVRICKTELSV